jgi:hypothetical protein
VFLLVLNVYRIIQIFGISKGCMFQIKENLLVKTVCFNIGCYFCRKDFVGSSMKFEAYGCLEKLS